MMLAELPDTLVAEVVDFAEFLRQKHQRSRPDVSSIVVYCFLWKLFSCI
jgi:hypothetical protein